MNVLDVCNLSLEARDAGIRRGIVSNLSFDIDQGQILGLAGANGIGKSLVAATLSGVLPPSVRVCSGRIELCGEVVQPGGHKLWKQIRGRQVLPIFQSASQALNPSLSICSQITESLREVLDLKKHEAIESAAQLLDTVGLPRNCLNAYPFELSGGMRQRVLVALAYGLRPNLIVADEPTTGLDPITQKQILDLLLRVKEEYRVSILFISHDLQAVAYVADRVAIMTAQGIAECQKPLDLLQRPKTEAAKKMVQRLKILMDQGNSDNA